MNILEQIVLRKRRRLNEQQQRVPLSTLYRALEGGDNGRRDTGKTEMTQTELRKVEMPPKEVDGESRCGGNRKWPLSPDSFNVIAEVKRASPSLGPIPWIKDLPDLVDSYQRGGAAAISVLTEEDYFGGSIADLQFVRQRCDLPVLRKDFLFTEYQLVESKLIGADAVLLITSLLTPRELRKLLQLTEVLGMAALVECRDRLELQQALEAGAKTVGINNRDLRTFEVSLERTAELSSLVPCGITLVSESGIKTAEDAYAVARMGASAILVGESCLRQADPASYVEGLVRRGRQGKKEAGYGTG